MLKKILIISVFLTGLLGFPFVPVNALSGSSSSITGSPDIIVPAVQGTSVKSNLISRAKTAWPWYLTRASGIVAAILLFFLLVSGVGLITGYTFKFLEPLNAWATHRAMGLAFFVAVIIHGGSLLFDTYIKFNIAQVLLPFLSNYRKATVFNQHVGSLWVALGVIAFYLILAIVISSLVWINKKPHQWKSLHFLAYLAVIFVFIHALYLGTDFAHGILRTLWIISGVVIFLLVLYRLSRAKSL